MTTPEWPLKRPPFRAQSEAIEKGWAKPGFNFYMEQGLGKSATTLANYMLLKKAGKAKRLIIVCPNSFKGGWLDEIEKAGVSVPTYVWSAGQHDAFLKFMKETKEWIFIINWEAISAFFERHGHLLVKDGYQTMLALDESIKMKNPRTQWTKAALWASERVGFVRNLSGKPITQGTHDLWAQLKAIGFIKKMNYYAFRNRFCVMGGYLGKQVVGAQNEQELNRVLNETSMLARKKDFTDLPPKLDPVNIPVTMTDAQVKLYAQMEIQFFADLKAEAGDRRKVTVEQIITRDIKLRQIMSGWVYDNDGNVETIVPFEENARFKALTELLEEQISGKSVIVCWYKPTIDMMIDALTKMGRNPAWIRGGMTTAEIEEQKRRFNEDDDCLDIVVQQRSAKYGHTLLGTAAVPCSSMVFFEQSYSLDDRSQVEDRIHRYGQVWPCSYFDFNAGKLDRAVVRALQRKESVAAAILGYAKSGIEIDGPLDDDEEFLRKVIEHDFQAGLNLSPADSYQSPV